MHIKKYLDLVGRFFIAELLLFAGARGTAPKVSPSVRAKTPAGLAEFAAGINISSVSDLVFPSLSASPTLSEPAIFTLPIDWEQAAYYDAVVQVPNWVAKLSEPEVLDTFWDFISHPALVSALLSSDNRDYYAYGLAKGVRALCELNPAKPHAAVVLNYTINSLTPFMQGTLQAIDSPEYLAHARAEWALVYFYQKNFTAAVAAYRVLIEQQGDLIDVYESNLVCLLLESIPGIEPLRKWKFSFPAVKPPKADEKKIIDDQYKIVMADVIRLTELIANLQRAGKQPVTTFNLNLLRQHYKSLYFDTLLDHYLAALKNSLDSDRVNADQVNLYIDMAFLCLERLIASGNVTPIYVDNKIQAVFKNIEKVRGLKKSNIHMLAKFIFSITEETIYSDVLKLILVRKGEILINEIIKNLSYRPERIILSLTVFKQYSHDYLFHKAYLKSLGKVTLAEMFPEDAALYLSYTQDYMINFYYEDGLFHAVKEIVRVAAITGVKNLSSLLLEMIYQFYHNSDTADTERQNFFEENRELIQSMLARREENFPRSGRASNIQQVQALLKSDKTAHRSPARPTLDEPAIFTMPIDWERAIYLYKTVVQVPNWVAKLSEPGLLDAFWDLISHPALVSALLSSDNGDYYGYRLAKGVIALCELNPAKPHAEAVLQEAIDRLTRFMQRPLQAINYSPEYLAHARAEWALVYFYQQDFTAAVAAYRALIEKYGDLVDAYQSDLLCILLESIPGIEPLRKGIFTFTKIVFYEKELPFIVEQYEKVVADIIKLTASITNLQRAGKQPVTRFDVDLLRAHYQFVYFSTLLNSYLEGLEYLIHPHEIDPDGIDLDEIDRYVDLIFSCLVRASESGRFKAADSDEKIQALFAKILAVASLSPKTISNLTKAIFYIEEANIYRDILHSILIKNDSGLQDEIIKNLSHHPERIILTLAVFKENKRHDLFVNAYLGTLGKLKLADLPPEIEDRYLSHTQYHIMAVYRAHGSFHALKEIVKVCEIGGLDNISPLLLEMVYQLYHNHDPVNLELQSFFSENSKLIQSILAQREVNFPRTMSARARLIEEVQESLKSDKAAHLYTKRATPAAVNLDYQLLFVVLGLAAGSGFFLFLWRFFNLHPAQLPTVPSARVVKKNRASVAPAPGIPAVSADTAPGFTIDSVRRHIAQAETALASAISEGSNGEEKRHAIQRKLYQINLERQQLTELNALLPSTSGEAEPDPVREIASIIALIDAEKNQLEGELQKINEAIASQLRQEQQAMITRFTEEIAAVTCTHDSLKTYKKALEALNAIFSEFKEARTYFMKKVTDNKIEQFSPLPSNFIGELLKAARTELEQIEGAYTEKEKIISAGITRLEFYTQFMKNFSSRNLLAELIGSYNGNSKAQGRNGYTDDVFLAFISDELKEVDIVALLFRANVEQNQRKIQKWLATHLSARIANKMLTVLSSDETAGESTPATVATPTSRTAPFPRVSEAASEAQGRSSMSPLAKNRVEKIVSILHTLETSQKLFQELSAAPDVEGTQDPPNLKPAQLQALRLGFVVDIIQIYEYFGEIKKSSTNGDGDGEVIDTLFQVNQFKQLRDVLAHGYFFTFTSSKKFDCHILAAAEAIQGCASRLQEWLNLTELKKSGRIYLSSDRLAKDLAARKLQQLPADAILTTLSAIESALTCFEKGAQDATATPSVVDWQKALQATVAMAFEFYQQLNLKNQLENQPKNCYSSHHAPAMQVFRNALYHADEKLEAHFREALPACKAWIQELTELLPPVPGQVKNHSYNPEKPAVSATLPCG